MQQEETQQTETVQETQSAAGAIEETEETQASTETETEEPEANYEIDGHKFRTQEEAFQFAKQQLAQAQTDVAIYDAYNRGLTEATNRVVPSQNVTNPPEDDNFEERFYSNPKAVLEEIRQKAKEEALAEMGKMTAAERADKEAWEEFTSHYPELAEFKEDVDSVASKHMKEVVAILQARGRKAAIDYVATKVKTKFDTYIQKTKPQKTLQRTDTSLPPAGTTRVVTTKKGEQGPVDFLSQLRTLKKSRMKS